MAKSRSIGGIYASLTLRDGGFRKGLSSAVTSLGKFAVTGAATAAVAGAAIATASTVALAKGMKSTMEMAGTLDDLSATTGVAISDAMRLRKAYELGGLAVDGVGKDIGKMQKAIVAAASGGADPFKAIGLSAQSLLAMSPADQFKKIGDQIMRISNPAERTAKAMEIFGKGGAGLTNVFGQFKDADQFLGKMPALFEAYGPAMARADDLINELPNKSQQFFTGFTAGVIGQLLPGLEKANTYDFSSLGENIGVALAGGLQMLTDGTAWQVFKLDGIAAIAELNAAIAGKFSTELGDKFALAAKIHRAASDGLLEVSASRFAKKREEAADMAAKPRIPDPLKNLAAAALAEKEGPAWQFRQNEMQVNDYQRRGLSFNSSPLASAEEKQTTLLTEVRNLLKEIASTREPLAF